MMKRIHLQLLSIILVSSWYLATTAASTGQSWEEGREGGSTGGREGGRKGGKVRCDLLSNTHIYHDESLGIFSGSGASDLSCQCSTT